jgi:hypothetical protein
MLSAGIDGVVKAWTLDGKQELGSGLLESELLEPALVIWQFRAEHGKLVRVSKVQEGQQYVAVWDISRLKLEK